MERPAHALCPRCSTRLGVEHDPDYGWCINCGPVRLPSLGPPLDLPLLHYKESTATEKTCIRCHKPITSAASRCQACNGNAMRGDKRQQQKPSAASGIQLPPARQYNPVSRVN
jgi:hypothetical protein